QKSSQSVRPTARAGLEQVRTIVASERRFGDAVQCAVAARAQIFVHDVSGGVFAAAAAASDRQFVLYIEERACAPIDSLADVFIGYGVAKADVHRNPRCAAQLRPVV
ncbi:MAG TPA: hypothetical protein VGO18_07320, partial [Steroidobacteraceae bacterium]|nr:hypothetical protein [Steroidobacteraceae bacterium]